MIEFHCNGGIGNRFNILVNALIGTHLTGEECLVHWPANEHLRAPVSEVVDVRALPPRMTVKDALRRVKGGLCEPYGYGHGNWGATGGDREEYERLYRFYGQQIILIGDTAYTECRPVLHIRALRQNIRIPWDAIAEELEGVENVRLCTDSRKALVLAMEKIPWFTQWTPITGMHDLHNRGNIKGIISDFTACCHASKLYVVAPRESAFTDAATHAYGVPTVRIE